MSVLFPAAQEVFSVRVFCHADIAIENSWANTYEVRAGDASSHDDLADFAMACCGFQKLLSLDTTVIDRAVVSTWVPDGDPYTPASFFTLDFNQGGAVGSPSGDDMVSLDVCLHLRRVVSSGRFGKLFLRGVLEEGDIAGRAGTIVLSDPSAMATRVSTALGTSNLEDYFTPGTPGGMILVMAAKIAGTLATRGIADLSPVGGKINKLHHKYFDRG